MTGAPGDLDAPQPTPPSGQSGTARLTQKGGPQFSDDVMLAKAVPYVQIRGISNLFVNEITSDREVRTNSTVRRGQAAVVIHNLLPHSAAADGRQEGQFSQGLFTGSGVRYNNGWSIERVVH